MTVTLGRRTFLSTLGIAAALPLTAFAQESNGRTARIGILSNAAENDPAAMGRISAVIQRLKELGWIEGRNLQVDYRWSRRERGRLQAGARELVRLKPDLIVTNSTPASQSLQKETTTIPIVFAGATDPLASGLVKSLAHPGGNLTGFTNFEFSVGGKWLELLKQIAPVTNRVLVLLQSGNDGNLGLWRSIETAAAALSVQVSMADFNIVGKLDSEVETFARTPGGSLIVLPNPSQTTRKRIVALAFQYRLASIYPLRNAVIEGGLMSYSYDELQLARSAADYADRILKGERPGDLPVQQPTKFELTINLKTAKALGIAVPNNLLVAADEVIE